MALLDGYNELEKQEIYFASPSELNDPMEGYRDIFWKGDRIVWNNLLLHYLRTLTQVCVQWCIEGEEHQLSWSDIPTLDPNFPKEWPAAELMVQIEKEFLSAEADRYINALAAKTQPMRQDELATHLRSIHPFALATILLNFERAKLIPSANISPEFKRQLEGSFNSALIFLQTAELAFNQHSEKPDAVPALFAATRHINAQLNLIQHFKSDTANTQHNRLFVTMLFPDEYIEQLNSLLYPDWFTACFLSDCSNSALWGYYGDNHKGVCLKFKTEEQSNFRTLTLQGFNSISSNGPQRGPMALDFKPVRYVTQLSEIDFFRSLGRLPIPLINKNWYRDELGQRSTCMADVFNDEQSWRNSYWEIFGQGVTAKLKAWEAEAEHRLTLHSHLFNLEDKSNRKLQYNFDSLAAVIFGMKTPLNKKLEICKIIQAKCKVTGRNDFKFYQAYYSPQSGKIEHAEMGLLNKTFVPTADMSDKNR